jgi:hypothetical protein
MDLTGYVWRRFMSGKNRERKATILESTADMLVQCDAGILEHFIEGTLPRAVRTDDALKATISDKKAGANPESTRSTSCQCPRHLDNRRRTPQSPVYGFSILHRAWIRTGIERTTKKARI